MSALILYAATAAAVCLLLHRCVQRVGLRAGAVLVLLPLLFTGRALFTGAVYAPVDLPYSTIPLESLRAEYGIERLHNGLLSDVYCLNIPWKAATRAAITSGQWPLWNPFSFCGDILAASAQPTPYEPFFLLSLLLPFSTSLTFLASITLFLAGALMFVFLRELDCARIAALAGSAAWMFSMFLVFWLEWVITPTLIWLPLVLLGVRRIVRHRSLGGAAILTAAFVEMLLNGHPESALHMVTVGLLWALGELAVTRGRELVKATLLGVGAGALALLITAIYMLPIIEALPQTSEHLYRQEVFANEPRSVPLPRALHRLEAHFVPFLFGVPQREWPKDPPFIPPAESAYCGGAALALALFGLWRSRSGVRWAALALTIGGLVLAIEVAPFPDLLAKVPLYDIALNSRFAVVAAFGVSLLAALGVDAILRGVRAAGLAATAAVSAGGLGLLLWRMWPDMSAWPLSDDLLVRETLLLLLPPLVLIPAAVLLGRRPSALAVVAIACIAIPRTLESGNLYPTIPARAFYPPIPLLSHLPEDPEPYRIVGFGHALLPNTATVYRLEDVRGYQAMTFLPMAEIQPLWSTRQPVWFNRVNDLTTGWISLMNVRFALVENIVPIPDGWKQIAHDGRTMLLENLRVQSRAFVPRRVGLAPDPGSTWGAALRGNSDFAEKSWISVPEPAPVERDNGPGTVHTRRDGMNAFVLTTDLERDSWIVVSQMAWKGWRAYVDGKPAKVHRANHAFLGIYAPGGKHEIRLVYLPHSFVVGRAVSAGTVLILAGALVWWYRRRRAAGVVSPLGSGEQEVRG